MKKQSEGMGTLHETFMQQMQHLYPEAVVQLLEMKLLGRGVKLKSQERRNLFEAVKGLNFDRLTVSHGMPWNSTKIVIDITNDDVKTIESAIDRFMERLPEQLQELVDRIAISTLTTLRKNWKKERRRQESENVEIQRDVRSAWGTCLDLYGLCVSVAQEFQTIGSQDQETAAKGNPHQSEALSRLQARACQIAVEVQVLLRNGLADGALARWRTMHECAVMILFLGERPDAVAERYLAHDAVECRRAAKEFLRLTPESDIGMNVSDEATALDERCKKLEQLYGQGFTDPFGWVGDALANRKPTFVDIEKAVGLERIRPYYRMASHNVHAGPRGLLFRLGLLGGTEVLLTGPSNVGLTDPLNNAARSLLLATNGLLHMNGNIDRMVAIKVLSRLVDELDEETGKAERRFEDPEWEAPARPGDNEGRPST